MVLVELVVEDQHPVSLTDMAARAGMARQTVHRVARQLEEIGLLQREPLRDRYTIGPRLRRMALGTLSMSHQIGSIHSILEGLVSEIGETCNIALLDGRDIVYLDRVENDWLLRVQFQAGSRLPAHCTANGKVLLAYLTTRQRHHLLSAPPLKRYTPTTLVDPKLLEEELLRVREQGYATNNQEYALGLAGLAVPVFDHREKVIAALAVHALEARMNLDQARQHLPALQAAAGKLSSAIEESLRD